MKNELNISGIFPIPIATTTIALPDISKINWVQGDSFLQSEDDLHKRDYMKDTVKSILDSACAFSETVGWRKEEYFIPKCGAISMHQTLTKKQVEISIHTFIRIV